MSIRFFGSWPLNVALSAYRPLQGIQSAFQKIWLSSTAIFFIFVSIK